MDIRELFTKETNAPATRPSSGGGYWLTEDYAEWLERKVQELSAKQTTLCEYCGGETYLAPICKKPGCLGQPME